MVFNQAECSILVWYQDELGARLSFLIIALVFTVDGETYTAVIGELILPQLSSPTFIAKSSVSHQSNTSSYLFI